MANIGIDLGTTNSLVGVYQNGQVKIIRNNYNEELTPSVVGLDDDNQIIVGQAARERLTTHPERTAAIFKPFLGTGKQIQLGENCFSVEELSALILRTLKTDAERFLANETIDNIIISVPAYFNNCQRNAVKNSAIIAGLKVEKVISEPTAAALSYGMSQPDYESTFIVLDLGGGTFDVSLMEQFDGIFDIKASAGHNRLGGEDFLDILVERFLHYHQINRSNLTAQELASVRKQCEHLKRNLTNEDETRTPVKIKDNVLSFQMSNRLFEDISKPLLEKFKEPVLRVLQDTNTSVKSIDYIVLVGGASRMAIFQDLVKQFFPGSDIIVHDPDKAVVKGATLQSELDSSNSAIKEIVVTDVAPYTLGVDVYSSEFDDCIFQPIIERNAPIPISKAINVVKSCASQKQMRVDIYQGESLNPKNNLKIGTVTIPTPWQDPGVRVSIQLTYDFNSMIDVDVFVPELGIQESLTINNNNIILTDKEIIEKTRRINQIKVLPVDKYENRQLITKMEALYEKTTGMERENIKETLGKFYHVLESGDSLSILKMAKDIEFLLSQYDFEEI